MINNLPPALKEFSIATDYVYDNIYIIGGKIGSGLTDYIYIFDTIENKIERSNRRLNIARCNARATILNNSIYIIGGETSRGAISSIEKIDIIDKYNLSEVKIL